MAVLPLIHSLKDPDSGYADDYPDSGYADDSACVIPLSSL